MKNLILVLTLTLGALSANASELSPEQQVMADVIVRQVVVKKLLNSDQYGKSQTKMLTAMVNREVKAPYTSIRVTAIECDQVLGGKDKCHLGILDATDDGTESLQDLEVTIDKGAVKSALVTLIAG